MFSNLVTSLIDYRREPTTAKANALDMIRRSMEDDLCRAVTLSDPLIKNNSRLFENSTTFLHFLSQLSTVDLIACNRGERSNAAADEPDWAIRRQLEECRKQIREQNALKEEEIKFLKRQLEESTTPSLKEQQTSVEHSNSRDLLRDCEERLRDKTLLVRKLESQLDEMCSKSKFEALKLENEQHLDKIRQLQTSEAVMQSQGVFLETQVRELERNLHNANEEKRLLSKELEQLRREIETLHPPAILEPDTFDKEEKTKKTKTKPKKKKRISPNTGRPAVQLKDDYDYDDYDDEEDEEMVDLRTEINQAATRPQLEYLARENDRLKLQVSELRELTQRELQRQQQELTQDKSKLQSMFGESAKKFQEAIENERSFYEKKLKTERQQLRDNVNELKQLLSDKVETIEQLERTLAEKKSQLADCLSTKGQVTEYEDKIDQLLNSNAQLAKKYKELQLSFDKLADVHLEEEEKVRGEFEAREQQLSNVVREIGRQLGVQDSDDVQYVAENAIHNAGQLSRVVREIGRRLGSEDVQYIVDNVADRNVEKQLRNLIREMGRQLGVAIGDDDHSAEDVRRIVEEVINFTTALKSIAEGVFDDVKRVADKYRIGFNVVQQQANSAAAPPHKMALEHLDRYIGDLTRSMDAVYNYLADNVPGVKPVVSLRDRGDVILDVVDSLVNMKKPSERVCKMRPVDYSDSVILLNRVLVIKYFELVYDYVIDAKTKPKIDPAPAIKELIDIVRNGDSTAYNEFVIGQLTLADDIGQPNQTFYDSLRTNLDEVDPKILDFFRRYDAEIRSYIVGYIDSKMQEG